MVHLFLSALRNTTLPTVTHGLPGTPRAQRLRARALGSSVISATHPDEPPFASRTSASVRGTVISDTLHSASRLRRPSAGPLRRRAAATMVSAASFPENVVAAATAAGASSGSEAGAAGLASGIADTAAAVTAVAVPVLGVAVPASWALGLTGGVLIGAASSLHLYLTGRIMGASGIVNGEGTATRDEAGFQYPHRRCCFLAVLPKTIHQDSPSLLTLCEARPTSSFTEYWFMPFPFCLIIAGVLSGAADWKWRAVFLLSLLTVAAGGLALGVPPLGAFSAGDAVCSFFLPATWQSCSALALLSPSSWAATLLPALAGISVGYGSQMGSGCTSGHGVCGLPRLAVRSAVAVATFMFTGAVAAISSASFPALADLINRGTSSWGPTQALALAGQPHTPHAQPALPPALLWQSYSAAHILSLSILEVCAEFQIDQL